MIALEANLRRSIEGIIEQEDDIKVHRSNFHILLCRK